MKFFTLGFVILLISTYSDFSLYSEKLEKLASRLQTQCESQFSPQQKTKSLSSAFICGTDIVDFKQQHAFQSTGLIHLIVVSGSHLKVISLLLVYIISLTQLRQSLRQPILLLSLFLYCLLTGFQAPILRALFLIVAIMISQHWRLNWTMNLLCLVSGLILLLIFPAWIFSFSFYLSWLASLGFCFPLSAPIKNRWSSLLKFAISCLLIQFFLSLLFKTFSFVSLFTNLLFAPILSVILWPISLVGLASEKLIPVADYSWLLIVDLLRRFSHQFAEIQSFQLSQFDWFFAWILICILHSLFFYIHHKQRRT